MQFIKSCYYSTNVICNEYPDESNCNILISPLPIQPYSSTINIMGCAASNSSQCIEYTHEDNFGAHKVLSNKVNSSFSSCWRDNKREGTFNTNSVTSLNNYVPTSINEIEVDMSHFSSDFLFLGQGGFGLVRQMKKLTGSDANTYYACKSMSKVNKHYTHSTLYTTLYTLHYTLYTHYTHSPPYTHYTHYKHHTHYSLQS